jgi:hypothetical protein
VARETLDEGVGRLRDVECEIDAISRIRRRRRSKEVREGRESAKGLENVEECRVPEEIEAITEVGTPTG